MKPGLDRQSVVHGALALDAKCEAVRAVTCLFYGVGGGTAVLHAFPHQIVSFMFAYCELQFYAAILKFA